VGQVIIGAVYQFGRLSAEGHSHPETPPPDGTISGLN